MLPSFDLQVIISILTEANNSARTTETMLPVVPSTAQKSIEVAGGTVAVGAILVIVITIAFVSNTTAPARHIARLKT